MYYCIAILALIATACAGPLQNYVNQADSHFAWSIHSRFRGDGYRVVNINLTSQMYDVPGGVTPNIWRHWLTVCIPDNLDQSIATTAHLHINDGMYTDPAPTTLLTASLALVDRVCSNSQILSVQLSQIPEQPLVFGRDPLHMERIEDQILAFGWAEFLNHTDTPIWITRLAMVKAAVRAMDVIQAYTRSRDIVCPEVENFIVSGASKRGWVTWLVPAVDTRVVAMLPMMMPILNMIQIINSEFRVYNGWPFAFSDYVAENITPQINMPVFHQLTAIEDPINYLSHYTNIPKFVITTTEDEFFLPDSPKFFWNQLPGEKHLNVINNADHDVDEGLDYDPNRFYYFSNITVAFINQITLNLTRPRYSWNLIYSNTSATIEFQVLDGRTPTVRLWQGTTVSAIYRDFRRYTSYCGDTNDYSWTGSVVDPTRAGYYRATVQAPPQGWTGFELEATYHTNGGSDTFKVTSNVNVVPDSYPFKFCYDTGRCGVGVVNGGVIPHSSANCPEFRRR